MKKSTSFKSIHLLAMTGLFLVSSATASEAQIWKDMGKKIEKKVEDQASRRLERKIDKTIDKGFDTVEGAADDAVKSENKKSKKTASSKEKPEKKSENNADQSAAAAQIVSAMSQQQSTAPLTGTYTFEMGITYEMQSISKKKSDKVPDFTLWISEHPYMGMASAADNSMFMVLDDGKMIAFMEKKKSYMVIGSGMMEGIAGAAVKEAEKQETASADYSFSKIGSENILGQPCDIYKASGPDTEAKVWITNSLGTNMNGFMSGFTAMMKNNKAKMPGTMNTLAGVMMKMESKDVAKDEVVVMTAKTLHKDGKSINASEYKSLGF